MAKSKSVKAAKPDQTPKKGAVKGKASKQKTGKGKGGANGKSPSDAISAATPGAEPIRILHFSDVLCVWAYVAQVRMEELVANFGDRVAVDYYFVSIFGDAHRKLDARWRDRGGIGAYADHVREVAERFPHVVVHPEVWTRATPRSSAACHAFLRVVKLLELDELAVPGAFEQACWRLRTAFFAEAMDVSSRSVQFAIAEALGISRSAIEARFDSGEALAELSRDLELAKEYGITVSPSLVFNEGRQRLNGNVGYRVIEANIRELLHNPPNELSWC